MALFEAENLSCVRGERTVFAGLSLRLDRGEALLLSGPNGSGKSSLLRLAAGLLHPAGGRLLWDGSAIAADPEGHRARLAYVGHQDAVKPVLSAGENLAFWAALEGGEAAAVPGALAHFGLAALVDVPGRMLSSGQRRRLNLARLLTAPAALWLLDEPSVGLDEEAVAALEAAIARHSAGGGLVLVASHLPLALGKARELRLAGAAGTWGRS
ncbi:MAG: heme ABC exporter ATP-binding protein CcmA [Alphaproteobacteria bacterium]